MKKKNNLVDMLFLIILSVQTGIMGIAFATQVLRIYYGEGHYSREICIEYLKQILPVLIIWLLMVIAGFIYFLVVNRKEKNNTKLTNEAKLQALMMITPKASDGSCASEYHEVKEEEKKRLIAKIINIVILAVCSLMGILYVVNPKHFSDQNPTEGIINMSYYLLPWVIIALISSILCVLYIELSCKKQIAYVKQIIKSSGRCKPRYAYSKRAEVVKNITTYSLLAVAITLIIVGVIDGSAKNVLLKAVIICTECIGLG